MFNKHMKLSICFFIFFQAGPIPKSLGELDELRYLSLDGNNFSGTIPDIFEQMVHLGELIHIHSI